MNGQIEEAMTDLEPMLAQLARDLPLGDYLYEPKWDGLRCVAFVRNGKVELRSRNEKLSARYFPEVSGALANFPDATFDGELVADDSGALLDRVHPSQARVEKPSREKPATFILFDVLHWCGEDLTAQPFVERRRLLERIELRPPLALTPITGDAEAARAWLKVSGNIDGVIAKKRSGSYQAGKRGWVKVKLEQTADCVVGGFRPTLDAAGVGSLLLGLYDGDLLVHVGVSSSFPEERRRELLVELFPSVAQMSGHPWEHGFQAPQDWVPLAPDRVCEVAYDKLDGVRFRHPARFLRWRPDRNARSCTLEQLHSEDMRQPCGR